MDDPLSLHDALPILSFFCFFFFFFQAEDGIRDWSVTGVQTCALPIWRERLGVRRQRHMHHIGGGTDSLAQKAAGKQTRTQHLATPGAERAEIGGVYTSFPAMRVIS